MVKNYKDFKVNPQRVNWEDSRSILFFNQWYLSQFSVASIVSRLPNKTSHIWLMSSGSRHLKLIALSKEAILCSAHFVNVHLGVSKKDRWGVCLPLFHIGGLSILARAYLSQSAVFYFKARWSVPHFISFLKEHRITLVSLVPAQVYDLVQSKIRCPVGVRCVLVGGASLNKILYQKARKLRWPVLPSYGLTECSSQVATASLDSLDSLSFPPLKILSHIKLQIKKKIIGIQSNSLLTGFMYCDLWSFQELKKTGWYWTGDLGLKKGSFLTILHREDQIKILSEKVNFKNLEEKWMQILLNNRFKGICFLLPVPHLRDGFNIILVANTGYNKQLFQMVWKFNQQVLPFEKIKSFYFMPSIPTSPLSKILKKDLWKMLGFSAI